MIAIVLVDKDEEDEDVDEDKVDRDKEDTDKDNDLVASCITRSRNHCVVHTLQHEIELKQPPNFGISPIRKLDCAEGIKHTRIRLH